MSKKIYNQNNLFMLSCQYARLLISLTAAAVAFFFLDKKETKNQERGDASAHRLYSSVGVLRTGSPPLSERPLRTFCCAISYK